MNFDAGALWEYALHGAPAPKVEPAEHLILLWRISDHVFHQTLDPDEARFLESIHDGEVLDLACERAVAINPSFDPGVALTLAFERQILE